MASRNSVPQYTAFTLWRRVPGRLGNSWFSAVPFSFCGPGVLLSGCSLRNCGCSLRNCGCSLHVVAPAGWAADSRAGASSGSALRCRGCLPAPTFDRIARIRGSSGGYRRLLVHPASSTGNAHRAPQGSPGSPRARTGSTHATRAIVSIASLSVFRLHRRIPHPVWSVLRGQISVFVSGRPKERHSGRDVDQNM